MMINVCFIISRSLVTVILVPLIKFPCSSNPVGFEFSVLRVCTSAVNNVSLAGLLRGGSDKKKLADTNCNLEFGRFLDTRFGQILNYL